MTPRFAARACVALVTLGGLCVASPVSAYTEFDIQVDDMPGVGFNDTTKVSPVGGNAGKTLGEQRLIALQHAVDLWGEAIDSEVEVVVSATWEDMGCGAAGETSVLGVGGPATVHTGITDNGADPTLWYPSALANRLSEDDIDPGSPDILITFNLAVEAGCGGGQWYYGLDQKPGNDSDFVYVALHELGHGLGFASMADPETGALFGGLADAFTTHVYDNTTAKHWPDMSDAERAASAVNAHQVAWDGEQTTSDALDLLDFGSPSVTATPPVAGFSGIVTDANFGARAVDMSVGAALIIGNPISGCGITPGVAGKVVLLRPACTYSQVALLMENFGAVGVLMVIGGNQGTPPWPIDGETSPVAVSIPVLSITDTDATLLETAVSLGPVTIGISGDASIMVGADDSDRVYLHAELPTSSSSISHWALSPRPNLLMEPVAFPPMKHGVDLARSAFIDMGYTPFCGNSTLQQEEECDEGADNDDVEPNACRSNCMEAGCGDGVLDKGEACDEGDANSDEKANACRTNCKEAHCGDSVVDEGEPCDDGKDNGDEPDACRSDCVRPTCGDGVRDQHEQCDDGADNADDEPNACRTNCRAPDCGDGIVDDGEICDDGVDNDDATPGACRTDCKAPWCGDGVLDEGEACDDGANNSDGRANACRTDCKRAHCGDGTVDTGEQCDGGDKGGDCQTQCGDWEWKVDFERVSTPMMTSKDAGGCSVRAARTTGRSPGWALLVALLAFARLRRVRIRAHGQR